MSDASGSSPSWDGFGTYLRGQRELAKLTLRQLASLTDVSNAYLSQIERGLHRPSLAVLKSIADALDMSVEALLAQAGLVTPGPDAADAVSTEAAIRTDPRLSSVQKAALLTVYRSMVGDGGTQDVPGTPATSA